MVELGGLEPLKRFLELWHLILLEKPSAFKVWYLGSNMQTAALEKKFDRYISA